MTLEKGAYKAATKNELLNRIEERSELLTSIEKILEQLPLETKLNDLTKTYIKFVYNRTGQNKVQTAKALGISIRAVRYYFNNHTERLENKTR